MLDDLKLLLGIENTDNDDVLQLMLNDAVEAVLSYCHIDRLPDALMSVVRSVVIAQFNYANEGNVLAIKRGDTNVTYSEPIGIEDFTLRQKQSLNMYRKWRAR